jgi:hypothetical protein
MGMKKEKGKDKEYKKYLDKLHLFPIIVLEAIKKGISKTSKDWIIRFLPLLARAEWKREDNGTHTIVIKLTPDEFLITRAIFKNDQDYETKMDFDLVRTVVEILNASGEGWPWFMFDFNKVIDSASGGGDFWITLIPIKKEDLEGYIKLVVKRIIQEIKLMQKRERGKGPRKFSHLEKYPPNRKSFPDEAFKDIPVDDGYIQFYVDELKREGFILDDGTIKVSILEFQEKARDILEEHILKHRIAECAYCKRLMIVKRSTKKYCSDPKCRVYANREKHKMERR